MTSTFWCRAFNNYLSSTRGIPISDCLAKSPTSLCKGGDTSDIGNGDAPDAGANDDYVADIIVAQEA